MPKTINVRSVSELAKGQGVDSAFKEHVALLKKSQLFDVYKNDSKFHDILHIHTFDLKSRSLIKRYKKKHKKVVVSCHVMPDSLDGSLKIPPYFLKILVNYMIKFYSLADRLVVVNAFYKKELSRLGLTKEILFEKYASGSDSDTFSEKINHFKNNPEYYSEIEKESSELSDYYSEKNVLRIWETFYSDLLNT